MNIRITVLAGLIASVLAANIVVIATDGPARSSAGEPAPSEPPRAAGSPRGSAPSDDAGPGDPRAEPPTNTSGRRPARGQRLDLPFEPPQAGLYRYDTTSEATFGGRERSKDEVVPYRFGDAQRVGATLEQRVAIGTGDDRLIRTNRWAADGLFHLRDEHAGGEGSACTYEPPKIVLPFPARVGITWEPPPASCRETGRGSPTFGGLDADVEESWRIVRSQELEIGGVSVATIVLEGTGTASFSNEQGSGEMRSLTRLWFAPSVRLFVKTYAETEGEFQGTGPVGAGTFTSVASTQLRSLEPV